MSEVADPRMLPDDGLGQSSMAEDLPGSGSAPAFAGAAETHVAAIFFAGERVYKLKKPVDLGFLDFRDPAAREWACRREYELNRRLAPDVYLDVAEVRGQGGDVHDHVVVMRRMPAERSLAALVRAGRVDTGDLREIARQLAGLHGSAPRSPEISGGTRQELLDKWDADLRDLEPFTGAVLDSDKVAELAGLARSFLRGRGPLLQQRVDEGRVVDGHGDLLGEDVFCLDDGPRLLDCVEFDDQLRHVDGVDDAACLAMDLHHRGAPQLADEFLARYREFTADPAPVSLLHHYVAYRALVRTKVACLKDGEDRSGAAQDAQQHLELALDRARLARVRAVLVGGLPGTGKSTLAAELADRLGACLVASDRVRTELFGDAEPSAYGSGQFTAGNADRVYGEVLDRAERLLARGETVVLDASWTSERHRRSAREAAERTCSELVALQCTASEEVVRERLGSRTATLSAADEGVADAMAAEADAWDEALTVPTDQPDANKPDATQRALDAISGPSAPPQERRT